MRIASDFHDYYDVGMAEGQDQTLVYERYRVVEERDHYPFGSMYYGSSSNPQTLYVRSYTIGFCGEFYKLLELNTLENGPRNDKEGRSTRKFAYNLGDVDTFVRQHFPKQYGDYLERHWQKGNGWSSEQRQNSFDSFFNGRPRSQWDKPPTEEELNKNEAWRRSWFEKHRTPIFVGEYKPADRKHGGRIVYNAPLKPLEFYRIFDPYRAFQEVSMWMGNQAVPIKPIPEISDEIMAEIKGFNKFSFRKDPSSKKRKHKG